MRQRKLSSRLPLTIWKPDWKKLWMTRKISKWSICNCRKTTWESKTHNPRRLLRQVRQIPPTRKNFTGWWLLRKKLRKKIRSSKTIMPCSRDKMRAFQSSIENKPDDSTKMTSSISLRITSTHSSGKSKTSNLSLKRKTNKSLNSWQKTANSKLTP